MVRKEFARYFRTLARMVLFPILLMVGVPMLALIIVRGIVVGKMRSVTRWLMND